VAHGATTEDEEGYVEGLRHSARLEGGDVCKVSYICRGVRIRKEGSGIAVIARARAGRRCAGRDRKRYAMMEKLHHKFLY
jgi:hypothetical protein